MDSRSPSPKKALVVSPRAGPQLFSDIPLKLVTQSRESYRSDSFVIAFQGLFKFGLYEVFKVKYAEMLGEENAYLYRTGLYLAASASAEFFADMGEWHLT